MSKKQKKILRKLKDNQIYGELRQDNNRLQRYDNGGRVYIMFVLYDTEATAC